MQIFYFEKRLKIVYFEKFTNFLQTIKEDNNKIAIIKRCNNAVSIT